MISIDIDTRDGSYYCFGSIDEAAAVRLKTYAGHILQPGEKKEGNAQKEDNTHA